MVAGPGTGKSTTTAGVFYELKQAGINAEIAPEYAKDIVWEGSINKLENQVLLLGKQEHRIWRLKNKVDVIITDCPLFLFMYYGKKESENFKNLALELFNRNDNMTYFLNRVKKFNPAGRVQDEAKSKQIDAELLELLNLHSVKYARIDADGDAAKKIASDVLERLNNGQR
jgi:hypothetical protein